MAERRKKFPFAEEALELHCGWRGCDYVDTGTFSFADHIANVHIYGLTKVNEDLHCMWQGCLFDASSIQQLQIHAMFHCFHTKLKCLGSNQAQRENLPHCVLRRFKLIEHINEPQKCHWKNCDCLFENPEAFYRHTDNHATDAMALKECNTELKCNWKECMKSFTNKKKLIDHLKAHTKEKLTACPTCGSMFASRTKLFDHLKKQAVNPEQVYPCPYCIKNLATQRLLHDHVKIHINHYKCPHCDMSCPTPSNLATHVKYVHSDERKFPCVQCQKAFKSLRDLNTHATIHNLNAMYACAEPGCDYSSRSRNLVACHFDKMHGNKGTRKYICSNCQKTFARGTYLTNHLVRKHNFCLPSGHCRFKYSVCTDGYWRLQTDRYESFLDQTEPILTPNHETTVSMTDGSSSTNNDVTTGSSSNTMFVHNSTRSVSVDNLDFDPYPTVMLHIPEQNVSGDETIGMNENVTYFDGIVHTEEFRIWKPLDNSESNSEISKQR